MGRYLLILDLSISHVLILPPLYLDDMILSKALKN